MTDKEKIKILRQAVMVGVAQLYATDREDVVKTFSLEELQDIVDVTEPLRPRQVEDIYKEALKISDGS